jgi:hypothetical protein
MDPMEPMPLERFLRDLLRGVHGDAQLVEFAAGPPDHYTLRIALPGEPSKTLILARRLVDPASTTPAARHALEVTLLNELLPRRPGGVRETVQERRAALQARRRCPACQTPIGSEHGVGRAAGLLHVRCAARSGADGERKIA